MATLGTQGAIDSSAAVVGDWSDVNFIVPNSPWDGLFDRFHVGNVTEGVLELTREDYIHVGTALPRVADYVVPIRAGMRFTGNASEHHAILWHALMNDSLNGQSAVTGFSNYIYPGVQGCNTFFTLQAMRKRACDSFILEARIFKVHAGGAVTLGSSDESVTTPMELEGLDDQADTMHQGGGANAPLGYIYLPTAASAVGQFDTQPLTTG
jgi:hypothetical protein